ncbi:hypothetical protein K7E08_01595 [Ligilactobacillus salivarius]|uniref:Uncharacterized protein n=1 Tax=Ligilactobacillus salivarius NIAS840 TaxID=1029822 RepID=F5VGF2_9LACO|nr:hypothetical protein [Ligilactobacillus salivarius]HBU68144.1 hypothetical protein [Lactobacillus sp.]EGL98123.1 hypothetical protein NIAS840_01872 [Ligilactobacillus salivarius NIAS840]MBZ4029674.1 hypothetical protein [Ligilactobacillus salivarius]MDU7057429.1 hypothetical protein [Ligilactobacillus salivarius]OQQ73365.1 hypothetical protein BUE87_08875 [Ligilactobacillus salivarius]
MKLFNKSHSKNSEWYFPGGKDLQMESGSNASLEMFKDNPLDSLAREICQNSLDAGIEGSNKPVRVEFTSFKVKAENIPGYLELRYEIIDKAMKQWPNEQKTMSMLRKMDRLLKQKYVNVLKISDYNTTGLRKENWKSLIEQVGSSVKKDSSSAGSFGIGKGAPFAVSDLRMVLYSTLADEGIKSIGVMKFVSYKDKLNGETIITQGTGYYGENGSKKPISKDFGLGGEISRTEKGTDIYIIGFNQELMENWTKEITYSLANNFLFSFYTNKLEVVIDNKYMLDYSKMNKIIEEIRNDKKLLRKYEYLPGYYDVLQDEDHKEFNLTGFKEYGIKDGEAILYTSNKGNVNRRVLMTRNAGMKIKDLNRISSIIKFSGIFYAHGKNINRILKQLENPNHNDWSKDRSETPKKDGRFLKDMNRFIKETIKDTYTEKVADEVDAYGVSDFLPEDINSIRLSNKKVKDKGHKKVAIEIEKINTKSKVARVRENNHITGGDDKGVTKGGVGQGDSFGTAYDGRGHRGGSSTGNNFGYGDRPGENGPNDNDDMFIKNRNSQKKITNVKYRCIEVDHQNGMYRLMVKPDKSLSNVRIDLDVIGDSGKKDTVQITKATYRGKQLNIGYSNVYIQSLLAGSWQPIMIKLNGNTRLKLEVEIYANI